MLESTGLSCGLLLLACLLGDASGRAVTAIAGEENWLLWIDGAMSMEARAVGGLSPARSQDSTGDVGGKTTTQECA